MKKYIVISDIHGALSSAQKLEELANQYSECPILCLGDVLYHGPRNDLPEDYAPKQVIEIMNRYANRITAVRGNCDAEVDQMVLNFPLMETAKTISFGSRTVFMSHGHVFAPDALPKEIQDNDIFLSGHTHIPTAHIVNGKYLLNPGSISLPKENHPRSYAILTEDDFTVYTIDDEEYIHCSF